MVRVYKLADCGAKPDDYNIQSSGSHPHATRENKRLQNAVFTRKVNYIPSMKEKIYN